MTFRILMLALAVLGSAAPLAAQRSPPPAEAREAAGRGPVQMLLRHRERLGLTADQVARLQAVDRRMEERNRPAVARLLEMRRQIRADFPGRPRELEPARREEYRRRLEAARPLLREIRENNRVAMREVGDVLTPAQKGQVREILRRGRRHEGGDGERRRRGHRG
jgi:Spy/CpxP family protein refolding chaperone